MSNYLPAVSQRTRQVLQILSSEKYPVTVNRLSQLLKTSKRLIYYDLKTVDDILESLNAGSVQLKDQGYMLNSEQRGVISEFLKKKMIITEGYYRVCYIICSAMYPKGILRIETFAQIFEVSRNTVLRDLSTVKKELENYKLALLTSRQSGYYIEGDTFRKRSVLLYYLKNLIDMANYTSMELFDNEEIESFTGRLKKIFELLLIPADEKDLIILACFISIIRNDQKLYNYSITGLNYIFNSKELKLVNEYFPELNTQERTYLAIHFLCSGSNRDFLDGTDSENLLELSHKLVNLFEIYSCVKFDNEDEISNSIYLHIKLSNYIFRYSVPTINPLMDEIKENYNDLYEITKQCCDKLKNEFPYPVFESEITYITMHFGTYIRRGKSKELRANVLVVCPNGKTSSMLLKSEIESQFESIKIVDVLSIADVKSKNFSQDIDFVISTVSFICEYPLILVHPILTEEDKSCIASFMMISQIDCGVNRRQLNTIMDIIRRNVDDKSFYKIRDEMYEYLNAGAPLVHLSESPRINLIQALESSRIKVDDGKGIDLEKAIYETAQPLLMNKCITTGYINKMLALIKKYGPYIVISPEIAIAHAQPEDGARRLGVCLTIYSEGLAVGEYNIHFLFVLAVPNQKDHLHILQNIVMLNDRKDLIEGLIKSKTEQDALKLLNELYK